MVVMNGGILPNADMTESLMTRFPRKEARVDLMLHPQSYP
jgi:hypothetical protein